MINIFDVANFFVKRALDSEEVMQQTLCYLAQENGICYSPFIIKSGEVSNKELSNKYKGIKIIKEVDKDYIPNKFSLEEIDILNSI